MKIIIRALFIFLLLCQNLTIHAGGSLDKEDSAFIVEVPFYCPPPKIQNVRELIKEEPILFQKKVEKRPEKGTLHKQYKFNEIEDFIRGKEPYRIAEDDFRGFLKLYNSKGDEPQEDPVSSDDNQSIHEKVKSIPETDSNLLHSKEEVDHINQYVQLFRDEAFGQSREESKNNFQKSMRMALLLNRYKSISSILNRSIKRFNDKLNQDKNILILRGFWEPKWEKKVRGKWQVTPLKEVRHYFLEYLKNNQENALNFLIENEGGEINGKQVGRLKGIFPEEKKSKIKKKKGKITFNTHVPYQELREAIRIHPNKEAMVKELRKENEDRLVYEAIHDNDLTHLRVETDGSNSGNKVGLYSYYQQLIADHDQPVMLTTGYRAVKDERFKEYEKKYGYYKEDDYFGSIFVGIEEDRYARAAVSQVDPRLAYYSEPNLIVKIDSKKVAMPYSFLDNEGSWTLATKEYSFKSYDPHESMNILKRIYETHKDKPGIIFDPKHPVLMRLPERMLVDKHTSTLIKVGHCQQETSKIVSNKTEKDNYSFLEVSKKISQSCLSFRDYSQTVYAQLGLKGKKSLYEGTYISYLNDLFTSILSSIFNSYDPVEMIKEVNNTGNITEKIEYVNKNYKELVSKRRLTTLTVSRNVILKPTLKKIEEAKDKNEQLKLLKECFNLIFQQENLEAPIDLLIRAAENMGTQRLDIIKAYYTMGIKGNGIYAGLTETLKLKESGKAESLNAISHPTALKVTDKEKDPFQQFSIPKLKMLVEVLISQKATQAAIAHFCGYKSATPIRNLLGKGKSNVKNPEAIWAKLTKELSSFCEEHNLDIKKIRKACKKDPAFN